MGPPSHTEGSASSSHRRAGRRTHRAGARGAATLPRAVPRNFPRPATPWSSAAERPRRSFGESPASRTEEQRGEFSAPKAFVLHAARRDEVRAGGPNLVPPRSPPSPKHKFRKGFPPAQEPAFSFTQSLWRALRSGLGELRHRHMRHRRQRRRGTLQRGPLSRCGFTSFLKGAAERLRRVFASPTPCTRPHAQSIRAGTRLGPEVLIVARRAATGAQSMHFVRACSQSPHCLIIF